MSYEAKSPLSGVFPIVTTPFTADNAVDHAALVRVVDHIAMGGAHGAVYPAIASEFATLAPQERHDAVATAAKAAKGKLAFVVGISDETPERSAAHARQAAELGADAVMLMAPRSAGDKADGVEAFSARRWAASNCRSSCRTRRRRSARRCRSIRFAKFAAVCRRSPM